MRPKKSFDLKSQNFHNNMVSVLRENKHELSKVKEEINVAF